MTITIEETKRRLLVLADYVEKNVKDDEFDMGSWKRVMQCGTVACAGGHACMIPEFVEKGLHLEFVESSGGPYLMPVFEERKAFGALAAFFGILQGTAEYLFDPGFYEDDHPDTHRLLVVSRLRQLAKEENPAEWEYDAEYPLEE